MPYDLSKTLVIGISSRSLFDLEEENRIFEERGLEAYRDYQIEHEDNPPPKGTAFHLVEGLLRLNQSGRQRDPKSPPLVEVVIMSRNSAEIGLRLFNATKHYGLDITRGAFTSGTPLSDYLDAFSINLFLSKYHRDVSAALEAGVAAAIIQEPPDGFEPDQETIRIAFDGDAVIFSNESERIYQEQGIEAFLAHERENARRELPEGPFAKLLRALSHLQQTFPAESSPLRMALVTARHGPAIERVIRTLRDWRVNIHESFFLGGVSKDEVLKAFRAHIFFDDQRAHIGPASRVVPSGHVENERDAEAATHVPDTAPDVAD
ncbi:MAG: 5'-nucleotidase [Deltaproteobacteria bacterium]|nr:5'-nucleotidase [Deltaproteobacteria bacterium]